MFLMEKRGNSRMESRLMKTLRGKGPVAIGGAVGRERDFRRNRENRCSALESMLKIHPDEKWRG